MFIVAKKNRYKYISLRLQKIVDNHQFMKRNVLQTTNFIQLIIDCNPPWILHTVA